MRYLPSQHAKPCEHEQLWDTSENKRSYFAIPDEVESGAVPAELQSGGFAIHHCLMPHRSLKNGTDHPRRGISMHFMDAKMPDPPMMNILPEGATPILPRGQKGLNKPVSQD